MRAGKREPCARCTTAAVGLAVRADVPIPKFGPRPAAIQSGKCRETGPEARGLEGLLWRAAGGLLEGGRTGLVLPGC